MGNRQKKRKKAHAEYSEEVYDGNRYCGLIARNSEGRWGVGWNMIPATDSYVFATAQEARNHLVAAALERHRLRKGH